MPKEPLFPHRPKSKEPQFPHVPKGETHEERMTRQKKQLERGEELLRRAREITGKDKLKHFWVEQNPEGTWAVVEAFPGGTVRSPFNTKEEAIKREYDIGQWYGWNLKQVPSPQEKFPKQHEVLKGFYPYDILEYHDDGDLTIQSYDPLPRPKVGFKKGDIFVVTTDGKIYKQEGYLATKLMGDFIIRQDRMGNIIITYTLDIGKSVFLQFEADKELVCDILTKEEKQNLDAGWRIEIRDDEPRSIVLQELWEVSVQAEPSPSVQFLPQIAERVKQYPVLEDLTKEVCYDFRAVRSVVMRRAWEIMDTEKVRFRDAIKKAWDEVKRQCLKLGAVV